MNDKQQKTVKQKEKKQNNDRVDGKKISQIVVIILLLLVIALAVQKILKNEQGSAPSTSDSSMAEGTLMIVNGDPISTEVFRYQAYSVFGPYAAQVDEHPYLLNTVKRLAEQRIILICNYIKWAKELGIDAHSMRARIDAEIEDEKEMLGEKFAAYLLENRYTEASFEQSVSDTVILEALDETLRNPEGKFMKMGENTIAEYCEEQGFYAIQMIRMSFADGSEQDIQRRAAQMAYQALRDGEPFEELMQQYTDEDEREKHPNGYILRPGETADVLEQAALGLECEEISEVLTVGNTYYILKRVEPDPEELHERAYDCIYRERVENKLLELRQTQTVQYAPNYDQINMAALLRE